MEAMSILAPHERCVRAKLQFFLRLWVARQKYEHLRPFGETARARLEFHRCHLEDCWSKVVKFQRVLALESAYFAPREHFELIYIVTAFIDRELASAVETHAPANPLEGTGFSAEWPAYKATLQKLGHHLNPFEFGEICARCWGMIEELKQNPFEPPGRAPQPPAPITNAEIAPPIPFRNDLPPAERPLRLATETCELKS
jgi:hypothetical protein